VLKVRRALKDKPNAKRMSWMLLLQHKYKFALQMHVTECVFELMCECCLKCTFNVHKCIQIL